MAAQCLRLDDIDELKTYTSPPEPVLLAVLPVVVLFRQKRGTSGYPEKNMHLPRMDEAPDWEEAKFVLNNERFFADLVGFDHMHVSDALLALAKPFTLQRAFTVCCLSVFVLFTRRSLAYALCSLFCACVCLCVCFVCFYFFFFRRRSACARHLLRAFCCTAGLWL